MSLARKQERMRRETVGATLLAVSRYLREEASKPSPRSLVEVAEVLEERVRGPVKGAEHAYDDGR
jgi:hypothetical protein